MVAHAVLRDKVYYGTSHSRVPVPPGGTTRKPSGAPLNPCPSPTRDGEGRSGVHPRRSQENARPGPSPIRAGDTIHASFVTRASRSVLRNASATGPLVVT